MRRTFVATLGLLLLAATGANAQQPAQRPAGPPGPPPSGNGEVRGTIVDAADSTPVPRATIAVRAARDSALVTGTVSADNGSFRVQGLRPGRYYLRVTSIGFAPRSTVPFALTDSQPTTTFARIRMSRVATELQTVEVRAEAAAVTVEGDRNVYRANQVAPAAANASEVLQNTPSVEVDPDGKVSLRGNENVAVQINGRPTPIRGAQLGQYLKQLPANIVDRIEVIPTPSARHDPEGMAGIINIVLKQQVDIGRSGGFNLSGSPSGRYNASGNMGNQSGAWTLFGSYGFNYDSRPVYGVNNRERYGSGGAVTSYTEQDVDGDNQNYGHNVSGNVEYKINQRDVLSNNTNFNIRTFGNEEMTLYRELNSSRTLTDQYFRGRNGEQDGSNFDNALVWRRTYEPRKRELTTEFRFTRSLNEDITDQWREPVSSGTNTEIERGTTDARTNQAIAQVDFYRPLFGTGKLETGYKGTGRWLDNDYLLMEDENGDGTFARSDRSNAFEFDEQVHAAYAQVFRPFGKWDLQGGLRAERASRDFILSGQSYPFNYTSLFPSAIANYKLSDQSGIRLAYSRRIRRPGTQELNPFPMFMDPNNVMIGNPNVNPEYTDAFEVSWNRNYKLGTLQVSPFYRRTKDVIRFIIDTRDTVDGREVTSVSFQNLATGESWGADANGSLRLGPKLSAFGGFNIHKMVTEGGSVTSALSSNAVMWSFRLNATSQITPRFSIQGNYFYRAPQKVERGEFSKQQMLNVVIRQKVQGDRGTVSLRVVDPFNTMGFRVRAGDEFLSQLTTRKFAARSVWVGYQWAFGQQPRLRVTRPPEQAPESPNPFGQ